MDGKLKPALGHDWSSVPTARLYLSIPSDEERWRNRIVYCAQKSLFDVQSEDDTQLVSYKTREGTNFVAVKREARRLAGPMDDIDVILLLLSSLLKTH